MTKRDLMALHGELLELCTYVDVKLRKHIEPIIENHMLSKSTSHFSHRTIEL